MNRSDDIKKYLQGNRKGKEANKLEKESLSDPFLFEALQGLNQTPKDPIDGIIRLERLLDSKLKKRKRQKTYIYSWVASIALIITFSVWLIWPQSEQQDLNQVIAKSENSNFLDLYKGKMISGDPDNSLNLSDGRVTQLDTVEAYNEYLEIEENIEIRDEEQIVRQIDIKPLTLKSDTILKQKMEGIMYGSLGRKDDKRVGGIKPSTTITGTVKDTKGNSLAGVTVISGGWGSATDANGNFKLFLDKEEDILKFSFIGMKSQMLKVTPGSTIEVIMEEDSENLEEVIVTGYTNLDTRTTTSAISSIRSEELMNKSELVGKLSTLDPSLNISRDSQRQVRLRGTKLSELPLNEKTFIANFRTTFKYPDKAPRNIKNGEILVKFKINKSNRPTKIKILKSFSEDCNKQIIASLADSSNWHDKYIDKTLYASFKFIVRDGIVEDLHFSLSEEL